MITTYLRHSVTRLGDFLNLLASNFQTKVAQIFNCFLGKLQNQVKPDVASFWATIGKYGQLFIPTSGRTAQAPRWLTFILPEIRNMWRRTTQRRCRGRRWTWSCCSPRWPSRSEQILENKFGYF